MPLESCVIRKFHLDLKTGLVVSECWRSRTHMFKMRFAEMRMLRWMCGHTRRDKIRNEVIQEKVGVASWWTRPRKRGPRWFGHVKRAQVRRCEGGRRGAAEGRGRPKKYRGEVIRRGLGSLHIRRHDSR
ncbi:hypothetical protein H5410_019271 [Solanum commersonii]|uniref:Uncharacterized protein n=1 Tax=Solanum commersonii TaxID=4109 RepID=A0A9J6A5U7_SOLCO|nr:hypothetical protein H5410_019271 [Solanum commersonii]